MPEDVEAAPERRRHAVVHPGSGHLVLAGEAAQHRRGTRITPATARLQIGETRPRQTLSLPPPRTGELVLCGYPPLLQRSG